jgi:hypothetical protein
VTGLVRAELIKLLKRKLYWVMLAIFAVVMAMVAFLLLGLPSIAPEAMEGFGGIRKPAAYTFGAAQALSQTWFPLVLGVVLLGGETGSTIWAGVLTMESRRWRHLLVRWFVTAVASWIAMLAAIAGWAAVASALAEGFGSPSTGEWLAIVFKAGLIQLTWVAIAFGAVGLLRSIGPALGLVLALSFGEGLFALWRPWQNVSISLAQSRLIGEFGELTSGVGLLTSGEMSFGHALAVVLGWTAVGVGAAVAGLQLRDP